MNKRMADRKTKLDQVGPALRCDYDKLTDADLIRLILSVSNTTVDASKAVDEFGSLWNLVTASDKALRTAGVPTQSISLLRLVRAASLRIHAAPMTTTPVLSNWARLLDHLQGRFAGLQHEEFWVLYLDRRNRLITEECAGRGTVDHCPVYPREVVKRSLEIGASALILSHCHPSGDPLPSRPDIEMTKKVIAACQPLDIIVHDHVIVGSNSFSMKAAGLM